jgi:hypothetical protein
MDESTGSTWEIKMKRIAASVIVGVLLLTTVAVGAAIAHTYVAETALTIHKEPRGATESGAKLFIFGRLKSARPACKSNKLVNLMRVRPGPDKILDRDRTDIDGNYRFVRHTLRDQTVYARFLGTFRSSVGHSHRCLSSRSRIQFINIS